jgi:hypothetical protein
MSSRTWAEDGASPVTAGKSTPSSRTGKVATAPKP